MSEPRVCQRGRTFLPTTAVSFMADGSVTEMTDRHAGIRLAKWGRVRKFNLIIKDNTKAAKHC